ncbi:MAG TPA: carboxymuconolactone decarboxylase family protein [Pseudomonadota bacterium]|nr:carboxymuconolactone decarboxylase family protein [Pseudomonadota bacterium]
MTVSNDELEGARQRVAERFGTKEVPAVMYLVPAEAVRDTALNLARGLDGDGTLLSRGDRLLVGLGVAVAKAGQGSRLGQWLAQAALVAGKSEADAEATRAVALTCATYNGYYKFKALAEGALGTDFDNFQPALRATPFVKSHLSKALVELICVAISVQNGCGHCVAGHVQAARAAGASAAAVDEAVRAGAVIGALASWEAVSSTSVP